MQCPFIGGSSLTGSSLTGSTVIEIDVRTEQSSLVKGLARIVKYIQSEVVGVAKWRIIRMIG